MNYCRNDLLGYGFCHLPTSPGTHSLSVPTWRPAAGSAREAAAAHYLGGGHRLRNPDLTVAASDRHRLTTAAAGAVHVQVGVVLRNFDKYGVEF